MVKFDITAKTKKARHWTKKDDIGLPDSGIANLTKVVPSDRPHRVWRTDFTYLAWRGIRFYLSTVLDAYSREIVGYAIGMGHTKEFVLEGMKDALRKTKQTPEILHSDQ